MSVISSTHLIIETDSEQKLIRRFKNLSLEQQDRVFLFIGALEAVAYRESLIKQTVELLGGIRDSANLEKVKSFALSVAADDYSGHRK